LTSELLNENRILLYGSTGGFGNRSRLHSSLTEKETKPPRSPKTLRFSGEKFSPVYGDSDTTPHLWNAS
jgi:hypothetical protein